jgi:hypothetical protein
MGQEIFLAAECTGNVLIFTFRNFHVMPTGKLNRIVLLILMLIVEIVKRLHNRFFIRKQ